MRRTPSQTVGPFYTIGMCRRPDNELEAEGIELVGRLLDGRGEPIGDGVVEVWDGVGRRWGRSGTEADGGFRFVVPRDAERLEAFVFARGLLRHQLTRIYLREDAVAEDDTLVARHEDGLMRFDIRMQGEQATVFFEH
jgi:protocatechuate 3,4-dioxygenase alpha subunit